MKRWSSHLFGVGRVWSRQMTSFLSGTCKWQKSFERDFEPRLWLCNLIMRTLQKENSTFLQDCIRRYSLGDCIRTVFDLYWHSFDAMMSTTFSQYIASTQYCSSFQQSWKRVHYEFKMDKFRRRRISRHSPDFLKSPFETILWNGYGAVVPKAAAKYAWHDF